VEEDAGGLSRRHREDDKNAYKILIVNPDGNRPLEGFRSR
jgi:hypothetical protein